MYMNTYVHKSIITFMIAGLILVLGTITAHACSVAEGIPIPTPGGTLADGGIIVITEILENGKEVTGRVLFSSVELPDIILHTHETHSCSERFDDFTTGEYIVTVTPNRADFIVNFQDLDGQFSWSYDNLDDATEKYTELSADAPIIISDPEPTPTPEPAPTPTPEPTPEPAPTLEPSPITTNSVTTPNIPEIDDEFGSIDFDVVDRRPIFVRIWDWFTGLFGNL